MALRKILISKYQNCLIHTEGTLCTYIFKIFLRLSKLNFFALYQNKYRTIFGLSKYSCIRIDKNIFGINSLFFYENQKFGPQGRLFVFILDFFKGVKVKLFRFMYV